MPEEKSEKPTPTPPRFSLRPPTKKEVESVAAERRKRAREEREARRHHDTTLILVEEDGSRVAAIHTAGWLYVPEESNATAATLKRVLGPNVPRHQEIPTKGIDHDREEELRKFLGGALDDPTADKVVLQFVDDIPE